MDAEDVLGDSIGLFGDERTDDDTVSYGPLTLTTAPKVKNHSLWDVHGRSSWHPALGGQGNSLSGTMNSSIER